MTLSAAAELDALMAAFREEITRTLQGGQEGDISAVVTVKRAGKGSRIVKAVVKPAWIDPLAARAREKVLTGL